VRYQNFEVSLFIKKSLYILTLFKRVNEYSQQADYIFMASMLCYTHCTTLHYIANSLYTISLHFYGYITARSKEISFVVAKFDGDSKCA